MAQINVNIRMDENLKRDFERFCDDIGLTMTCAFTAFAKAALRKNRIPFEMEGDPFYSDANMARLRKLADEMEAGHYVIRELTEDDE